MSYNATDCRDGLFGPTVWTEECRGGFDFTLAFEETLLTIAPSAAFLVLAVPRSLYLLRVTDKAKRKSTYTSKLVASSVYAALQLALLALVARTKHLNTRFSIASAVLNLLAACLIVFLAHIEHIKSIRPSFLLSAYLLVSLLFDATRLRTEWLISVNTAYAAVLSTSAALKLALLALETVEKRRILIDTKTEKSKESTSGLLSRGLFVWLNSLLISGWATVLTINELPAIYEQLSSEKLAVRFGRKWDRATQSRKKASIFLTILNVLKWELLSIAPPRVAMIGLRISQPFLVSHSLRFLALPASEATNSLGYALIGAFGLVFVGAAVVTAWYEHLTFRAGAMVRGGLITLIYRKMLKLPTKDINESSAVALMGNDVETLAEKLNALLVESWANVITVGISMWMLYDQLGAVCVAPIVMALVALTLSGTVGKLMVPRQISYQKATQDRINFISEVLGSIKAVKMLGFTERFRNLMETKRDTDLNSGKHYRSLIVLANAITNSNVGLTQAATFGAYAIAAKVGGNKPFSASQAITALSILSIMMNPLSELLGNIPSSFAAFGCFKRIEDFLYLDERTESRDIQSNSDNMSSGARANDGLASGTIKLQTIKPINQDRSCIAIVDGQFNWGETTVLDNINATFGRSQCGSLTILVGPIGSGKSSLLKAILGETTSVKGVVSLESPEIAFCDQTSWIMNATIRGNIVAESRSFDDGWYNTVIEACDLAIDFSLLPSKDQTVVGDKGLKLSGGQKQRLAIARALYSRKPVAIFDDVFSGLDKVTEQTVFTRVFGKNGLLRKNGTTTILATHAVNRLPESDYVIALERGGSIVEQGPFSSLRLAGGYIQSLDIMDSREHNDEEEDSPQAKTNDEPDRIRPEPEKATLQPKPASDTTIFKYYFTAVRMVNLAIMISLTVSQGFIVTFRSVWVTWWGNGKGEPSTDVGYWLGIYTGLALLEGFLISMAIGHFLMIMGPTGGKTLHTRVLNAAMSAPMSFLSNTDTGSLVNRFSQDMRLVDMTLPVSCSVFVFEVVDCIGPAALASVAVSWFALAIPFVAALLVVIQRFYVRTSKQLRLLEIEHKAPLYSHFLESIHGLSTIRAFGWTRPYVDKNLILLDGAQKPSYLLFCIQRWLTLVLDLVVAGLVTLLVVLAVVLRNDINPSLLGVALVNMMALGTNMKGIVVQWSTLETSLGAVTRIRDFSLNTPSENLPGESRVPSEDWPAHGALELKKVAVRYDSTDKPVLQDISLRIKHGEKIGLCGRSGSGKSSLIQAILRMADIAEGQMFLDGEDITTVPRALIRQKLSCLTQEAFLFSDTMRFNADPLEAHSDEEIVSALERVGLWSVILARTEQGQQPLGEKMDMNSLSHGQRQLFCLARALLKKSSILILDEPTSSVDSETDAKMQEVVRTEFKDRTIIMIAHRLSTLLDFDKIAVLDTGSLVEFGAPAELLADETGAFSRLYHGDKSDRKGSEKA